VFVYVGVLNLTLLMLKGPLNLTVFMLLKGAQIWLYLCCWKVHKSDCIYVVERCTTSDCIYVIERCTNL